MRKLRSKDAKGTKLVLLGTGSGPIPALARRMASNLMIYNGAAYVLDCGLGVTNEYARTGIPFSALRSIFITHHHPDVRQQIAAGAAGTVEAAMAHMRADHTSAEDAGRIAQKAGVKTLVLSHIGPPTVSDAAWQAAAGKYFIGEIIVGHDLAVI